MPLQLIFSAVFHAGNFCHIVAVYISGNFYTAESIINTGFIEISNFCSEEFGQIDNQSIGICNFCRNERCIHNQFTISIDSCGIIFTELHLSGIILTENLIIQNRTGSDIIKSKNITFS